MMRPDDLLVTLAAPPADFAWAWALERDPGKPLQVRILSCLDAPGRTLPREDELILWFGAPEPRNDAELMRLLSEPERARAGAFRFEADRSAFVGAHAGLRALLGSMLACAPDRLQFSAGSGGKPYLAEIDRGGAVEFNLSHTRGCVAVAVARCAVGVDVERRREMPEMDAMARMVFAPQCRAALSARSDPAARTALFFRYWTLGEAFIKATGEGIAQDLTSFAFTDEGAPVLVHVSEPWGPARRWRFDCGP